MSRSLILVRFLSCVAQPMIEGEVYLLLYPRAHPNCIVFLHALACVCCQPPQRRPCVSAVVRHPQRGRPCPLPAASNTFLISQSQRGPRHHRIPASFTLLPADPWRTRARSLGRQDSLSIALHYLHRLGSGNRTDRAPLMGLLLVWLQSM